MSAWLIAVMGVVYMVISVDLFLKGNTGLALSFLGYSIGNAGLTMVALK